MICSISLYLLSVCLSFCLSTCLPVCSTLSVRIYSSSDAPCIIKVKMGESTGLQGALPASLIIHKRPIHLQTAGILTNLFLSPFTDSPFPRLCLCMCVSRISSGMCGLHFGFVCVCVCVFL